VPYSARSPKINRRWRAYSFLLINTVVWGAAMIAVKPALDFTTPFRYLFYRYVFACLASLPFLFYYWPHLKKNLQLIPKVGVLEILGTTIALGMLYAGLARTSAIEASLLTTVVPFFVTLGGILFLKEKQERHEWWGLILALLGTLLLTCLPLLMSDTARLTFSLSGNLLIIGQNCAIAAYYLLAKHHYSKQPKLLVATLGFYVGLVTFFILSLFELLAGGLSDLSATSLLPHWWSVVQNDLTHWQVWMAALYMAIFGSIIGLTAYIEGQDGIEASEASLFTYLQPLVYLPLGVFLLGEPLYGLQLVALIIILGGVFVAEKHIDKKPKSMV
jgi:drug/metabolite transporter (DMT)-like permease